MPEWENSDFIDHSGLMQKSTSHPISTVSTQLSATGFQALSDPLRLQILDLLRTQELCVCELCEQLNVPQSKLSFHLKNLKEAELVRSRQAGRWIYYSLNVPQFAVLEQYLAEFRRFSSISSARCNP